MMVASFGQNQISAVYTEELSELPSVVSQVGRHVLVKSHSGTRVLTLGFKQLSLKPFQRCEPAGKRPDAGDDEGASVRAASSACCRTLASEDQPPGEAINFA